MADSSLKDLAVLVPSKGRPHNIDRLVSVMEKTCRGDTTLIVGLDQDDANSYPRMGGVIYEVSDKVTYVVPWMNHLARLYGDKFRYLGHIGDDNVPRTDGWDVRLMEALEQTPFAFGNDLYPREPGSLCCHIFMRSEVTETLGYMGPPSIRHMYVDPVWMAWGRACGITYLDDVILDHVHYTGGRGGTEDDTYRRSRDLDPGDREAFYRYCDDHLNSDIYLLGGTPYTEESFVQFLRSIGMT